MTVVPTGGIDRSSEGPLGCGPTDLCGVALAFALALAVDPGLWLDVEAADTEDGPAGVDPLLTAGWPEAAPATELELDDPPHAASSRASEPIPAAAANPLLRITSPISQGWLAVSGQPFLGPGRAVTERSRAVRPPGPGTLEPSGSADDVARRQLDDVPGAAHAVAGGGQCLGALVHVQRQAVVRDLRHAAVRDRAQRAQAGVGRAYRRLLARHRDPGVSAGAGARRRAALGVLVVGVENLPVAHGEDIANGGLLHMQHGRARRHAQSAGRLGGRVRRRRRGRGRRRGTRRRS